MSHKLTAMQRDRQMILSIQIELLEELANEVSNMVQNPNCTKQDIATHLYSDLYNKRAQIHKIIQSGV